MPSGERLVGRGAVQAAGNQSRNRHFFQQYKQRCSGPMHLREITIKRFGPFEDYIVCFPGDDKALVLLTGKNNEGKSSILMALGLVNAALQVIQRRRQEIRIGDDYFYRLRQQDVQELIIGRLIHNYAEVSAEIHAVFDSGLEVEVVLDANRDVIYADANRPVQAVDRYLFGFVPPLGQLADDEPILTKQHIDKSLHTSLAPRHLRNHMVALLEPWEFADVQDLVDLTWDKVQLQRCETMYEQNRIAGYYRDGRIERELSWAGQGLQVWFQILTHLVRLRDSQVFVLDEPEINLHAEKQHDLMQVLRDEVPGSAIVATHSVELMNSVSVSHIVHVEKQKRRPATRVPTDRRFLERVRAEVGSDFNFVASQFDRVDRLLFTEDKDDFDYIVSLRENLGIVETSFNVRLHGFNEYRKAIAYKEAYKQLIGEDTRCTIVLDRDYYPQEYLTKVANELRKHGISPHYTPGKEIENLFLHPAFLKQLFADVAEFVQFEEEMYEELRLESYSTYIDFQRRYRKSRVAEKTVIKRYTPRFDKKWAKPGQRWKVVDGKMALARLRRFHQQAIGNSLTARHLVSEMGEAKVGLVDRFIREIHDE